MSQIMTGKAHLLKIFAMALGIVLLIFAGGIFTVREGRSAMVLRLGKIVGAPLEPGLHYRIPLLDSVVYFDMRTQQLDISSQQSLTVVTQEQTYLLVNYFAKWRISNPVKFYTSTGGSVLRADMLLEQRLNDIVRAEYGKRTSNQAISTDRSVMMKAIREQSALTGEDLGVKVLDLRVRQITLPADVIESVFNRMASERKQFAEAKRAEGAKKSEEIEALADQQVTLVKAKALAQGAVIRAEGDRQAASIYAAAYNASRDFYAFYRSLLAYRESFAGGNNVLILKPEGSFFKYFHDVQVDGTQKK